MTSIPVLTTNVKTAVHPPSKQARQSRNQADRKFMSLRFAMTHEEAPTLSDVQQAAAGVLARWLMAEVLRAKGGQDGR